MFFCAACCFAPLDDDDDDTGKPDVALEKRVGSPLRTRSTRRSTASSAAAGVRGWNVSLQEKHARGAPSMLLPRCAFTRAETGARKGSFCAMIAGQSFLLCAVQSRHKQRSRSAWAATFECLIVSWGWVLYMKREIVCIVQCLPEYGTFSWG